VRVGINNNVSAQILDGLSEGDRVITGESGTGTRPATQGSQRVRRPMGF
jgi:macrolide-specific efflux system membrane fusion protein